jgi:hypothetical protein
MNMSYKKINGEWAYSLPLSYKVKLHLMAAIVGTWYRFLGAQQYVWMLLL